MIILQKIRATTQDTVTIGWNNTAMKHEKSIKLKNKNDRKKEKPVITLGDSTVKHINSWENNCRRVKFL